MITSYSGFTQREVGVLPISVGTSTAIEGLQIPKIPVYDALWINLGTLYRNVIQSVTTTTRDSASPIDVARAMLEDMSHLESAVSAITKNKIVPRYYLSHAELMAKVLPEAIVRAPQTPLQIAQAQLSHMAIREVTKVLGTELMQFKPVLVGTGRVLLLTHYATDLLGRKNFQELMLLESHTGKIKQYAEFNTKLTDGNELTNMPFNGFTLSVFGDNNVILRQQPRKIRLAVIDLAKQRNWTAVTTRDRIMFSIQSMSDAVGKQYLANILSKTKY